jgi:hypothetical protein
MIKEGTAQLSIVVEIIKLSLSETETLTKNKKFGKNLRHHLS